MSIEALDTVGRDLAGWILETTLWTAAIVAVSMVLDRLLRHSVGPGPRMVLFAVVFARLALPAGFSSPLGLAPPEGLQETLALPATHGIAAAPRSSAAAVREPVVVASRPTPWGIAIVGFYGLGLVLLGAGLLVSRRRLRRRIRQGRSAFVLPDGTRAVQHPSVGPLAIGGEIVIPRPLLDALTPEELRGVVEHERAHLRYRDPGLAAALAVVCVLAWPIIPVWLATRRLRFLMEVRADRAATAQLGENSQASYRRLMLRVAALGYRGELLNPAFGPLAALEGRLAALGRPGFGPLWVQLAATGTLAGLVLCSSGRAPTPGHFPPPGAHRVSSPNPTCPIPVLGSQLEPDDPELLATSKRLRDALQSASSGDDLAAIARRVLAEAEAQGLSRLRAEAHLVLGRALSEAGAYDEANSELAEAAWLGASTQHDGVAAVAAGELVLVELRAGRPDKALKWLVHAEAAHQRLGNVPLPHEERMLAALLAHYGGGPATVPGVDAYRRRLAVIREACGDPRSDGPDRPATGPTGG